MSNQKYKIEFSDGTNIVTYDDVILKYSILYKKSIDSDLLNQINKDNNFYNAFNKVVKYTSKRVRSKREIDEYISKMNILDDEKDKIFMLLIEKGFINDDNFARAYIADKLYLTNVGPNKIAAELLEHNIDYDKIVEYLNDIDKSYIYEKLEKLITKRLRTMKKGSPYIIKQKLKNEFLNLGYEETNVVEILNRQEIINNIEKDYQIILNKLRKKYSGDELIYKVRQKLYQKGYRIEEIEKIM